MSTINGIHSVLISFIMMFENISFKVKLISFELSVRRVSEYVTTAAGVAAKDLMESRDVKGLRRKPAINLSQQLRSKKLLLCELGTDPFDKLSWNC